MNRQKIIQKCGRGLSKENMFGWIRFVKYFGLFCLFRILTEFFFEGISSWFGADKNFRFSVFALEDSSKDTVKILQSSEILI